LEKVLANRYFSRRITPEDARRAIDLVRDHAVIQRLDVTVPDVAPHGSDAPVLAAALSANANYLVTGDKELLAL
jgi:predicted nucleic acid-binding protein